MSDVNIFRPATEQEKSDFVEIGKTNMLDIFLAKLAEKLLEYQKQYKPFDKYCARLDFDEQILKVKNDYSTSVGRDKVSGKIAIPDLDIYGKESRFELVDKEDVKEDKIMDGMRVSKHVGRNYNYRSKIKGNPITVFVPVDDVEKVEKQLNPI